MICAASSRSDEFFSRDKLKRELKKKSIQGVFIRVIANASGLLLTLGSLVVLARLLAPEDFGLFAMVIAVTEFPRSFMEFGLGTATVQRDDIGHKEVSTLFWINLTLGIGLMFMVAAISPAVAWFYNDTRLSEICLALSTFFLFAGLTVQPRSILQRQMRFGSLALLNVGSRFLSICLALGLAIKSMGVWALVAREVSTAAFYSFGALFLCKWMPSFPNIKWFNNVVKSSIKFGLDLTGIGVLQYFTQNLDRMLIGKFSGAIHLGFYSQASKLAKMPIEHIRMTILGVALPPLSATQDEPERYRSYFEKLLSGISFLYMPLVVFLAICSKDVIRLVLGERWLVAAPLFMILIIGVSVRPVVAALQLVMISCGLSRRYFFWGIVNSACIVLGFSIGIKWGAEGIAYSYTLASYGILVWSFWYCVVGTPLSAGLVVRPILLPLASSCGAGIFVIAIEHFIPLGNLTAKIVVSGSVMGLVYLIIWMCVPYGRRKLMEFWSYKTELLRKA